MGNFDDEVVQKVWGKGIIVSNYDARLIRRDICGSMMARVEYGNRKNILGWEVDHITPVSKGGGDSLSNLRPLQWENNAKRQDGRLRI